MKPVDVVAPVALALFVFASWGCTAWPYVEVGGGYIEEGGSYGEARSGVVLTPQAPEPARRPQPVHDDAADIWRERDEGWVDVLEGPPVVADPVPDPVRDPCAELADEVRRLTAALASRAPAASEEVQVVEEAAEVQVPITVEVDGLDKAAAVRQEVSAWSWRSVGMLAVLSLVGLMIYLAVMLVRKYL